MNQVHKENLTSVENALPNRQGLDIEIFGMEGVPEEIIQQHNQRIIQNFYTAQAERQAATGNPPRGLSGGQGPAKKIKYETPEELKKRLADHRAKVAAQKAAGTNGAAPAPAPADGQSPRQGVSSSPHPLLSTTAQISQPLRNRHPPSRLHNRATPTPPQASPARPPSRRTPRHKPTRLPPVPSRQARPRLRGRQHRSRCPPDPRADPPQQRRTTTTAPARRRQATLGLLRRRRWTSWSRTRRGRAPVAMISIS